MNMAVGMLYYFGDITTFDPTKNGEFLEYLVQKNRWKSFFRI